MSQLVSPQAISPLSLCPGEDNLMKDSCKKRAEGSSLFSQNQRHLHGQTNGGSSKQLCFRFVGEKNGSCSFLFIPLHHKNLVQEELCRCPGKGECTPQDQTHPGRLARELGSTHIEARSGNAGLIREALIWCCTAQNPWS